MVSFSQEKMKEKEVEVGEVSKETIEELPGQI